MPPTRTQSIPRRRTSLNNQLKSVPAIELTKEEYGVHLSLQELESFGRRQG
ncbi:MAG: hypothetical protein SFV54_13160 [Bryobacteraceae bacterium]|nr:hypothetical protein [Bryobacteraceae bacterium]